MTTPAIDPSSTLQTEPPQTSDPGELKLLPTSDEAKILSFVTANYQKIANARKATERQWQINLAFYFGRQYVAIATVSSVTNAFRLYVPPAPPWRVRLTVNKIRPIVRKEIASLFGQKPRFTVVPATTEDKDLLAARAGEAIFDWVYADKKVAEKLKAAGWWACNVGTGFIKAYWNPDDYDATSGVKGDICIEPVTTYNIFVPNFRALDIEEQPYVIHAMTKDPQWVATVWPEVKNPDKTTQMILDDSFLSIQGANSQNMDQVLVLEAWFKPGSHPSFPNGGMVTVVGGKIAQIVRKYPYDHGLFPFAKIDNIPSGKFYAHAMVDDLIPLQKEFNRTVSQIIEAKNMMGKLKLLAAKGSVDASKITSEPGQVIFYIPGFPPPTPMMLPELPSYIIQHLEQIESNMQDIAGLHDVSQGQMSPGTSATALSFLQEQDDTMLSDTTQSLEGAVEKIGRLVLAYANQYWSQARKIKIIGTDGAFDANTLTSADLNGNCDLRVESGSALPTSKAAKQAFVMDLMKQGFIPPDQGLEMLEIGGIEKVYDDYLADKHCAQRENLRLQMGGTNLYVNEWDNHATHITTHNRFRKSTTFEMLPDNVKEEFQNHVMAHQGALVNQTAGDPTGAGTYEELPNAQQAQQLSPPGAGDPNAMPGQAPTPDASMPPSPEMAPQMSAPPDPTMGGM